MRKRTSNRPKAGFVVLLLINVFIVAALAVSHTVSINEKQSNPIPAGKSNSDALQRHAVQETSELEAVDEPDPKRAYMPYTIYQSGRLLADYDDYASAVSYAQKFIRSSVFFREQMIPIWEYGKLPKKAYLIDAPLLAQMPELPRGCEVTSLAMMLQHAGIEVDKFELAEQIRKDPTPYTRKNGKVHFGNPYDGFVGDMYTFDKPGYGVYHGPVRDLAEQYLPDRIIDMTGSDFEDMLYALSLGKPVWVIVNSRFSQLPESMFQTWQTPTGPVKITYREHSVLLTGYDEKYIYFNDPLANLKDRKITMTMFQKAWEQMGKQAITYI